MINYGKHYLDKNDIRAVNSVLKKKFLTQGNEIEKFEKNLSNYFGCKYALAVSSGTSALNIVSKILNTNNGYFENIMRTNLMMTAINSDDNFIQFLKALMTRTFNEIITTNNTGHDFVDEDLTGKNLSGLKITSLEGCVYHSPNPPNFSRCDLTGCDMSVLDERN